MTEWHGGKGSRDRTRDRDKFNENFDRIFGKNRDKGEKKKQMSQKKMILVVQKLYKNVRAMEKWRIAHPL